MAKKKLPARKEPIFEEPVVVEAKKPAKPTEKVYRTKFKVESAQGDNQTKSITLAPCGGGELYGSERPVATIQFNVHTIGVMELFQVGEEFLVDFTKASKE